MRRLPFNEFPFPRRAFASALLSLALAGGTQSVFAESDSMDTLLDRLKEKGVLSDGEYNEMKQSRDEQRVEERAERRKRALKEAQIVEKEEKAKEDSKTALKGSFRDGFSFESGDKEHSIALTGRIHADYRQFNVNSTGSNTADTFDIRRAYIGISGKIATDFTFEVNADVAQTSAPQLDVAWVNMNIHPAFQFRIGQFKMPMSIEELTSSRFIDFQERSLVNALVPAKERGAMIHGSPYTGVFYGLALSNGAGKNNNEGDTVNDGKDFIGRLGANFAEMIGNKDMVLHVAGAYSSGEITAATAASIRTEGRGLTFFSPAAFSSATPITRTRKHGEVSVAWGPFKFQGEQLAADFEGGSGASAFNRGIETRYLEALWLITGEKYSDAYRGGAYSAIKPLKPFRMSSGGPGAWEIGLRASNMDATDFATAAGQSREADSLTIGLKWIPVTNVRFMLNYVKTDFEQPVTLLSGTTTSERAVTFRTALYF